MSALRSDIREDIAREAGIAEGGGDFYGPFWRDAKDHVFGLADLRQTTAVRIDANPARANLYPRLRDGFLVWWDKKRRWTNEPFRPADQVKAKFVLADLGATIKIDNILSVRDAHDEDHFVYPYFSPEPALQNEAGRLGLWVLGQALPAVHFEELRILDVIRGETFSEEKSPLKGDEGEVFYRRYIAALELYDKLRKEYD